MAVRNSTSQPSCVYAWMYVCIYVSMYLCIFIYIYYIICGLRIVNRMLLLTTDRPSVRGFLVRKRRRRSRRVDNKLPKLHSVRLSSICMKLLVSDRCAHMLTAHLFFFIIIIIHCIYYVLSAIIIRRLCVYRLYDMVSFGIRA